VHQMSPTDCGVSVYVGIGLQGRLAIEAFSTLEGLCARAAKCPLCAAELQYLVPCQRVRRGGRRRCRILRQLTDGLVVVVPP
jgi:hypothetical protein